MSEGSDSSGNNTDPIAAPYYDALHKLWLQHTSDLYDFCNTYTLRWPAPCVQFLRPVRAAGEQASSPHDYTVAELVVGSNCFEADDVGLTTRLVAMPFLPESDEEEFDDAGPVYSKGVGISCPATSTIALEAPATACRPMPNSNGSVLMTLAGGKCRIFCRERPVDTQPDAVLGWKTRYTGSLSNVTGVAWSRHDRGVWAATTATGELLTYAYGYQDGVSQTSTKTCFTEDAAAGSPSWHSGNRHLVATACPDGRCALLDVRAHTTAWRKQLHRAPVSAIALHPTADFLFATSAANSLRLWDMRKLSRPTAELVGHTDGIVGVEWGTFCQTALLSYGLDHTVLLWDLEYLGAEHDASAHRRGRGGGAYRGSSNGGSDEAPDARYQHAGPELVFMHMGHTAAVRQATWCPFAHDKHDWTVASVCDNNALQVWSPAQNAMNDYEDEDDDAG